MDWKKILAIEIAVFFILAAAAEKGARYYQAHVPPLLVGFNSKKPSMFNNTNVTMTKGLFERSIVYRLNSFGLRGPETTLEKPAGKKRLLAVGDSLMFGPLVNEPDSLPGKLQAALGTGWDVLNGGTSGYDAWDYAAWIRQRGLRLHPDVIVLSLYMNDYDNSGGQGLTYHFEESRPIFQRVRDAIMHSYLLVQLQHWVAMKTGPKRYPFVFPKVLLPSDSSYLDASFAPDQASSDAVKRYLKEYRYDPALVKDMVRVYVDPKSWVAIRSPLKDIRDMCRSNGIKLVTIIFPVQFEVYPGYVHREPHAALDKTLAELGIPYVDLMPVFAKNGGDDLYPQRSDYAHVAAKGYALANEAVLSMLR